MSLYSLLDFIGRAPILPALLLALAAGAGLLAWSRAWRLLGASIAFVVGSIAVFFVTISADPFAIFAAPYIAAACLVAPAGFAIAAARWGWPGWPGWLGAVLLALTASALHLWLIAAASASV